MKRALFVAAITAALLATACQPLIATPSGGGGRSSRSLWISPAEIARLPTSGQAWADLKAAATRSWGTPTIADQNSNDDTDTLAGALVAERLDDDGLRNKVRRHLMDLAAKHPYDRVLSLARQLPSYVIAADIVGLDARQRATFERFLAEADHHKMAGHSGGTDLESTALRSPNNWGTMSRAAMAAVAVYLGDDAALARIADTQEAWLGGSAPNALKYTDTTWHVGRPAGINPRGAQRGGRSLDGVLPEDQRRTGDYQWPAPKGSYPHEGLQGAVVTSVILHRAGALPFTAGDNALVRAERWLTVTNANPPANDDRNTPWLLRQYGNATFACEASAPPAKNIGWAAWTAS